MRTTLAAVVAALLLPACLVGSGDITGTDPTTDPTGGGGGGSGGGGGGGDGSGSGSGSNQPTPRVDGTIDQPTLSTELGKTETLNVTVTSANGFTGAVTVTPTVVDSAGNPVTGWALLANPTSVTLTDGGTAQVAISVKIPTDTVALASTVKVALASTAAAVDLTSAFTVAKQLTINIDAGTGTTSPHASLPLPNQPIKVQSGTLLIFHNADNIQHVIHGDGGIPHENTGAGAPGTDYKVTITSDGDFYCHDHEGSGQARIINVL